MYTVVQFIDWGRGTSISVVPLTWIYISEGRLMCYFPSKNATTSIKDQVTAHADWPVYAVKRLTAKTILSYDLAMTKQNKCILTSSVETTDDDDEHHQTKRKLFKKSSHYTENKPPRVTKSGKS